METVFRYFSCEIEYFTKNRNPIDQKRKESKNWEGNYKRLLRFGPYISTSVFLFNLSVCAKVI